MTHIKRSPDYQRQVEQVNEARYNNRLTYATLIWTIAGTVAQVVVLVAYIWKELL